MGHQRQPRNQYPGDRVTGLCVQRDSGRADCGHPRGRDHARPNEAQPTCSGDPEDDSGSLSDHRPGHRLRQRLRHHPDASPSCRHSRDDRRHFGHRRRQHRRLNSQHERSRRAPHPRPRWCCIAGRRIRRCWKCHSAGECECDGMGLGVDNRGSAHSGGHVQRANSQSRATLYRQPQNCFHGEWDVDCTRRSFPNLGQWMCWRGWWRR